MTDAYRQGLRAYFVARDLALNQARLLASDDLMDRRIGAFQRDIEPFLAFGTPPVLQQIQGRTC